MMLNVRSYTLSGEPVNIGIAVDTTINIVVNGKLYSTLQVSPRMLEELAIGYLYGEGVIDGLEDIEDIRIEKNNVYVNIKKPVRKVEVKQLTTECATLRTSRLKDKISQSKLRIGKDDVKGIVKHFIKHACTLEKGVAMHITAVYRRGPNLLVCASDVSRHASLDKVVGWLLKTSMNGEVCITTGRPSGDMVFKVAKACIPVLISLKKPLYTGYTTALDLGVTLISIVRKYGLTLITGSSRVLDRLREP